MVWWDALLKLKEGIGFDCGVPYFAFFVIYFGKLWLLRSKVKLGSSLCGWILEVERYKGLMMFGKKEKFTCASAASLHTIQSPQFSNLGVNLTASDVTFRTKEAPDVSRFCSAFCS